MGIAMIGNCPLRIFEITRAEHTHTNVYINKLQFQPECVVYIWQFRPPPYKPSFLAAELPQDWYHLAYSLSQLRIPWTPPPLLCTPVPHTDCSVYGVYTPWWYIPDIKEHRNQPMYHRSVRCYHHRCRPRGVCHLMRIIAMAYLALWAPTIASYTCPTYQLQCLLSVHIMEIHSRIYNALFKM
jgi:hypothetical protein